MRKRRVISGLVAIAGACVAVACGDDDDASGIRIVCPGEIEFADPALEAVVREAIDKPEGAIRYQDISQLTELHVQDEGVTDLQGLECLQELTVLYLGHNHISDLSPLSGLTTLEVLDLRDNDITEVDALSGLTRLSFLTLLQNDISDLSPLVANRGLGDVDWVNLHGNPLDCDEQEANIVALEDRGAYVGEDCS